MVVSMRPVAKEKVIKAVEVTARYPKMHGAPVHIGNPEEIGIKNISKLVTIANLFLSLSLSLSPSLSLPLSLCLSRSPRLPLSPPSLPLHRPVCLHPFCLHPFSLSLSLSLPVLSPPLSLVDSPDYGDSVTIRDGEVPVFWACGVTPQAVIASCGSNGPDLVITHSPVCISLSRFHFVLTPFFFLFCLSFLAPLSFFLHSLLTFSLYFYPIPTSLFPFSVYVPNYKSTPPHPPPSH